MQIERRFLPSTSLLSAFESAARLQSFTRAAQELSLTQSAVSRKIKALEHQLGVALFSRHKQKISLTSAGESYLPEIRKALKLIATSSMTLQVNPDGGTLNLAILPTFGARWLAPHMAGFLDQNPGITINFTTRLKPFDFNMEQLDAAIHFGQPDWPGTRAAFLLQETVLPACAPAFLQKHPFRNAGQLLDAPLIHISSRPRAWRHWFEAHGAQADSLSGMVFDQFETAVQAARHALGIALLPRFLIRRELSIGELVPAINLPLKSEDSYYLVWPRQRENYPPLDAFRKWITALGQA